MKLCTTCNQHFDEDQELCPTDGIKLVDAGKGPLIGKTLDDRYRILCSVGQGSMGSVFKAIDETTGREMAVKLLHSARMGDPNAQRRFLREAKTISALNHPNIVKLFNFGKLDDDQPYIVIEFLKGITLSNKIRMSDHISLSDALPILRQVMDAVSEAHRAQIIHRDLKPDNIVLEKNVVKVLDFGVAKMIYDTGEHTGALTLDGKVCGSPGYMSPEQCRGEELDFRSDVYALGIVIFETLTGRRPFHADDVMGLMYLHVNKVPPSLGATRVDLTFPEGLEKAVAKALSKKREDRQQSVDQLLDEIELSCQELFGEAKRPSSGWIPFEGPIPGFTDLVTKSAVPSINTEEIRKRGRAQAANSAFEDWRRKSIPKGLAHQAGLVVFGVVSFFLMYSAVKIALPVVIPPDLDSVTSMVAVGDLDRAVTQIDQLKRRKLTGAESDYVNDLLLEIGMKYAQKKNLNKATDTLLKVSKKSKSYPKASTLIKRYKRAISSQ